MVQLGTSSHGFCESDKLIYVCYIGGACGYAIRRMLLLSPDVDGHDVRRQDVRSDGAAHLMLSRSGLKRDPSDHVTQLNLNMIPLDIGLIDSDSWWEETVDPRLISYARSVINNAVTHDDMPVSGWKSWNRWVWVDHVPPRIARLLFPNAKIMLLCRDWRSTFRDYTIKNIFQPAHDNLILHSGSMDINCSIDARLHDKGRDLTRVNFKKELRGSLDWITHCYDKLEDARFRDGAYMVNVDRLLCDDTWQEEYDAMIGYCGLRSAAPEAKTFIDRYNAMQPLRGQWLPDPEWTWVKVGPNRPGRW